MLSPVGDQFANYRSGEWLALNIPSVSDPLALSFTLVECVCSVGKSSTGALQDAIVHPECEVHCKFAITPASYPIDVTVMK
jgi:hypothetical protein